MSSGRTLSSNSSGVRKPSETVASLSVVPSLWAFLAHLATSVRQNAQLVSENKYNQSRTVIAQVAVQNGCQHQRLVEESLDTFFVSLDADNTVLGERARA